MTKKSYLITGECQLEELKEKPICVKIVIRKKCLNCLLKMKKRLLGHVLRAYSLVQKLIEGQIEEKKEASLYVMLLDDINPDYSYKKIRLRSLENVEKTVCLELVERRAH